MASTNEQGWHPDVIELLLAHAERNKARAAYKPALRLAERTKMMQAWADHPEQLRRKGDHPLQGDDKMIDPSQTAVMRSRSTRQSQASRSAHATVDPRTYARSRNSGAESIVRFSTEEDLISALWELFGHPMSGSWTWLRELNSPCGIADLVAVSLSKGWQQQRSISAVPPRWLYPLKSLPVGQEFDGAEFATRFGVSDSCAHGVLSTFVRAGYCNYRSEQRYWVKMRDPFPIADRIVAIEAKLRNWRRALYQAVQYASYAFEAWVVLDGDALHSASIHIDEFEKRGIGLMGLTAKGHSEILAEPNTRPPRSQERFWQANAEIAKRLFEERTIVSS